MPSRQTAWLRLQFTVALVASVAACLVAIFNIARGENVALSVGILIAVPVIIGVYGWFIRRENRKEQHEQTL